MTDQSSVCNVTGEEVLFGASADTSIVAVEPDAEAGVRVYRRSNTGVTCTRESFLPWLLLTEPDSEVLSAALVSELTGEGYRFLAEFRTQPECQTAKFRLRDLHRDCLSYSGAKAA